MSTATQKFALAHFPFVIGTESMSLGSDQVGGDVSSGEVKVRTFPAPSVEMQKIGVPLAHPKLFAA